MIDKKPAVVRIALAESMLRDWRFGGAGRIVKMTPSGMLCAPLKTIEGEEEAPYPLYKFTAICDTEEEARMLQAFSWRCRAEMNDLRERHIAEAAKLVNQ